MSVPASEPRRTSSHPGIFPGLPCPIISGTLTATHYGTGVSHPRQLSSPHQISPSAQLLGEYQQQVCVAPPQHWGSTYTPPPDSHPIYSTSPAQPKVCIPLSPYGIASCSDGGHPQHAQPRDERSPLNTAQGGITNASQHSTVDCECGRAHMVSQPTSYHHGPYHDIPAQTIAGDQSRGEIPPQAFNHSAHQAPGVSETTLFPSTVTPDPETRAPGGGRPSISTEDARARICAAVRAIHDVCLQSTQTYLQTHRTNRLAREASAPAAAAAGSVHPHHGSRHPSSGGATDHPQAPPPPGS